MYGCESHNKSSTKVLAYIQPNSTHVLLFASLIMNINSQIATNFTIESLNYHRYFFNCYSKQEAKSLTTHWHNKNPQATDFPYDLNCLEVFS